MPFLLRGRKRNAVPFFHLLSYLWYNYNTDLKTISIIKENFLKRYPDMEHEVKTVELMIKMAKNSDEFDIVSKEIKKLQETINMRLYPDLVLEYRSKFGGLSPEIDKCIKDYEVYFHEVLIRYIKNNTFNSF